MGDWLCVGRCSHMLLLPCRVHILGLQFVVHFNLKGGLSDLLRPDYDPLGLVSTHIWKFNAFHSHCFGWNCLLKNGSFQDGKNLFFKYLPSIIFMTFPPRSVEVWMHFRWTGKALISRSGIYPVSLFYSYIYSSVYIVWQALIVIDKWHPISWHSWQIFPVLSLLPHLIYLEILSLAENLASLCLQNI